MAVTPPRRHRGTLCLENIELLASTAYAGEQFVARFHAPRIARSALPGSFVHLRCDASLPMRRPLSIMRADPDRGEIDLLYKIVGSGLEALAAQTVGTHLSAIGPIGQPFTIDPARPLRVLIGGGVGIPPMIFLAEHLRASGDSDTIVFMGSELAFPFETVRSAIPVPGIDPDVSASIADLENLGIAARLASRSGFDGCFDGLVTALAGRWIDARTDTDPGTDGSVRLRTDPDAEGGREARGRARPSVPGIARGIHGLRRRRLCRVYGRGVARR